jgi:hypothetical protein
MTTLNQHRKRKQDRDDDHNKGCALYHNLSRFNRKEAEEYLTKHSQECRQRDQDEEAQKQEMLADPDLAPFVCNVHISFQAKGKRDNYDIDELLENQFPQGVTDSESGEGHFYVNRQFLKEVKAFLKGKANFVEVMKNQPLTITSPKGEKRFKENHHAQGA